MANNDSIKVNGTVKEVLNNSTYRVLLETGAETLASLSGKMRLRRIQILQGDKVEVEFSPYDLTRGRIVYRH